jgi:hypothetical protein
MIFRLALPLLLAALALAGCATTQARSADQPPLVVPPAPPRVIEPAIHGEALPVEPLSPPDTTTPSRTPARTSKPDPARPDPKPDPPKPEPQAETPPSTPQLRLPQSADAEAAAREIRTVLDRGLKLLASVNVERLTPGARAQYDMAKLLSQQADEAIKGRNFEYARFLADKVETMGKELTGR